MCKERQQHRALFIINKITCSLVSVTYVIIKLQEMFSGQKVKTEYIKAILMPSMLSEHELRTPLAAAAATGNFPLFKTILQAVDRCIKSWVRGGTVFAFRN